MIITKPRVLFDYKMLLMNLFLRIMIVDVDVKKIHDDGDTYLYQLPFLLILLYK